MARVTIMAAAWCQDWRRDATKQPRLGHTPYTHITRQTAGPCVHELHAQLAMARPFLTCIVTHPAGPSGWRPCTSSTAST